MSETARDFVKRWAAETDFGGEIEWSGDYCRFVGDEQWVTSDDMRIRIQTMDRDHDLESKPDEDEL